MTAANAFLFDHIAGLPQTCGIDKHHWQTANVRRLFDRVACRAGNRRNDRAVVSEQLIEQTRLARVRPANDGRANAAPQNLSFVRRPEEFIHKRHAALQPREQLLPGVRRDVFIGKVNVRLDMRQRFHHVIAQLIDSLRKLAGELFVCRGQ